MGRLILACICLLPCLLWDYFTWMIRYSRHPEKTPLMTRYKKCKRIICYVYKRLKMDPIILGKENMVKGSACYIGNHLSALDCMPLFFAFNERPISFVAKIEIEKYPFVARVFKAGDGLFLNREDLKQGLRVMMKVEERLAKGETSYFIFAEGTRNVDQMRRVLPFHHGTFRAAMKAQVPIVPTVSYGSFLVLTLKHHWRKYPTITKFLKPIMPEEYANMSTQEVANLVYSRIEKELSFSVKKYYYDILIKNNLRNYSPYRIY